MTISDMVVLKSSEIIFDGFRGFLKFTFFRGFFQKIFEIFFDLYLNTRKKNLFSSLKWHIKVPAHYICKWSWFYV